MRFRFSLRALLVLVALCALALGAAYWYPKSKPLSVHESYVGHYRGLGLASGPGYFGTDWYRIVVSDDDGAYWEVDVSGLGYNPYRGFYKTGVLREEGACMVAGTHADIYPDRHDLLHGRFYNPDGKLLSEVRNGTGKQILCAADGTRVWELDLVDGDRASLKMWYPSGQLMSESWSAKGQRHRGGAGYHPNGQLKCRGQYDARGEKSGLWQRFKEDGTLESQTNHGQVESGFQRPE